MASNAFSGVGTKIWRNDPSAGWEALAEVNSITGPSESRDTIDVTSLDSTGGYREFITGFKDAGELSFSMNMANAMYDKLRVDYNSDTAREYKIVLADTADSTFSFSGLVTAIPITVAPDDKVTVDVTIKITGQVTFYAGSTTTTTT
jgi:predicted secreted protein